MSRGDVSEKYAYKHQCQRYIEVIRIGEKDGGIREIEPGQRMMSTSASSDLLALHVSEKLTRRAQL
ncbi:uncharacterized protein G6M90_00g034510 [Metarhizium brunneum]|uniref:Uncharacterized protein n=1 Tax=Metarhizium brunneum TaxID=500148 RepID=A0A7D5YPD9_9HYPO|nr:hypothetical protein G6M90_00g034510 [Metarhizium brunneum]